MKIAALCLLILLFFILLLIFPFRLRFLGHLNLINNICIYSIKVLFIKILVGRLKLTINNGIEIENQVNNIPDNKSPHFTNILVKCIVKKIEIDKLKIFMGFGIEDNAFASAMVAGSFNAVASVLIGVVLEYNPYAKITRAIVPEYNKNFCEATIVTSFKISLLSIIISYFKAKNIYKLKYKGVNNG